MAKVFIVENCMNCANKKSIKTDNENKKYIIDCKEGLDFYDEYKKNKKCSKWERKY